MRHLSRTQPVAGHGLAEQGADAGAPDGLERPATANRHRPRQGQRTGRHLRCDQLDAVHCFGPSYVNDFLNQGRPPRVVVQADAPARMQPDDLLKLNASNTQGKPVPLSAFASTKVGQGCQQRCATTVIRPCASRAACPGYSTGAAMAEMEKLAGQLPAGFGFRVDRTVARKNWQVAHSR